MSTVNQHVNRTQAKLGTIKIVGGNQINGSIELPGDKVVTNHILFAASALRAQTTVHNPSFATDPSQILSWVSEFRSTKRTDNSIVIGDAPELGELSKRISTIRASICMGTSSLASKTSCLLPSSIGGCSFASRPIDRHLDLMKAFGIDVAKKTDGLLATRYLMPSSVDFDCSTKFGPSVGVSGHALINLLHFPGEVRLSSVAIEPTVMALIEFVRLGTNREIVRVGRSIFCPAVSKIEHHDVRITIEPDWNVGYTILAAAMATKGRVELKNVDRLPPFSDSLLQSMNISYSSLPDGITLDCAKLINPREIHCRPWPAVPSDIGPVLAAGLAPNIGCSKVFDHVYDKRSSHVLGLIAMGYRLQIKEKAVIVIGTKPTTTKCRVLATDIRCGAALAIGALARKAESTIANFEQVRRGYPSLVNDLRSIGAEIYENE